MKNKQINSYSSNKNGTKSNYHKQRTNNYYKKNYHQCYKNNNSNGYYDNNYSWKDKFEYSEHPTYNTESNRSYHKKNNRYNNSNQYKKYNNELYDDEDIFNYINNSRNSKYSTKSNDNSVNNINTSTNIHNSSNLTDTKTKEEVMKVCFKLDNETKELIIYKNEDINLIVEQFCKENKLEQRLSKAIKDKVRKSIESVKQIINNKLNEKDINLLKNIKELYHKDNVS